MGQNSEFSSIKKIGKRIMGKKYNKKTYDE
jgi:hypothetical protein